MRSLVPALIGLMLVAAWTSPSSSNSASGSDTSWVQLGARGTGTGAFVAWPAGKGPWPAVVVIHEWWGLNRQIREVARRLTQQGYVAIVPDLYHGKVAGDPEQAHVLMRGLEDARALADLDAAAVWLRADPRAGKRKIGVVGFCMGGAYSLQFALHTTEVAAAVMFYGPPESDAARLAGLRVPLQGHFGQQDDGIPVSRVEAFRGSLLKTGKTAEIYLYPAAGHAFMHEGRPSYHPDAARQAWARTLAFFQKHLKS